MANADPPRDPSIITIDPSLHQLLSTIESRFASTTLGPTRWYLVALTALTGGGSPHLADQLYLHLTRQPAYSIALSRQALIRRLRESLVKAISIIGVCRPIEAITSIAAVEAPADRDYTTTRPGWKCDDANHERGMEWFGKVYKHNSPLNLGLFEAHRDFDWISKEITYGLYLSDRQVLDDVDTELVVLSGIMIQNLRKETWWHIRGLRRVECGLEDAIVVYDCIKMIAEWLGVKLDRVPSVEEVEPDV